MIESKTKVIELNHLTIGYHKGMKKLHVLENINAGLQKGEMVCLVGENGIGKSTLLRTLCGIQPALSGGISIYDTPLQHYTSLQLARFMSLVLTDRIFAGNLTVNELVALGRHPYTNWLGNLTVEDREKVKWAMSISGIYDLRERIIGELSDGQFQKVLIARALSQDGDIIILDEPTAHLDLTNKISILKLLKDLSYQTGKSILMATHELEFSIQIADRIWMMLRDEPLISGTPEDLMLDKTFNKLIKHKDIEFDMGNGRFSIKNKTTWFCNLEGPPVVKFWTANALKRNHWGVSGTDQKIKILADERKGKYLWILKKNDHSETYHKIEALINGLKQITTS